MPKLGAFRANFGALEDGADARGARTALALAFSNQGRGDLSRAARARPSLLLSRDRGFVAHRSRRAFALALSHQGLAGAGLPRNGLGDLESALLFPHLLGCRKTAKQPSGIRPGAQTDSAGADESRAGAQLPSERASSWLGDAEAPSNQGRDASSGNCPNRDRRRRA